MGQKQMHKYVTRSITWLFTIFCCGICFWQGYECVMKYRGDPQATSISMMSIKDVPIPQFTMCISLRRTSDYHDRHLNRTALSDLCAMSLREYKFEGIWSNSFCPDPKQVWENVTDSLDSIVYRTIFYYLDGEKDIIRQNVSHNFWKPRDRMNRRCYYMELPDEMRERGLRRIGIQVFDYVRLYFQNHGVFLTSEGLLYTDIGIMSRKFYLKFSYDIFDMLDYGESPCERDPNYSRDKCTLEKVEQIMIDRIGCTPPFMVNKKNICTNSTLALEAIEIYKEFIEIGTTIAEMDDCLHPCKFFDIRFEDADTRVEAHLVDGRPLSTIYIDMKQRVKVTTAYYSYTFLSLVAEFGGYVGLFLGMAVIQLADLVNFGLDKMFT